MGKKCKCCCRGPRGPIAIINGGTPTDPIFETGKLTITSNFLTIAPLNGSFQPSTTRFGFETFNGHYILDCE